MAKLFLALAGAACLGVCMGISAPCFSEGAAGAAAEESRKTAAEEDFPPFLFSVIIRSGEEAEPQVYDIASMTVSASRYTFQMTLSDLSAGDFSDSSCFAMDSLDYGQGDGSSPKAALIFGSHPWPLPAPLPFKPENEEAAIADSGDFSSFLSAFEKNVFEAVEITMLFPDHSSWDIEPQAMPKSQLLAKANCQKYLGTAMK